MKLLLWLFAPGAEIPKGTAQMSLGYDGWNPGWAFFLFIILTLLVIWSYYRFAPETSKFLRGWMIAFRVGLILIFLLLLVRPVLNISIAETIRRKLIVLLDVSQSMQQIQDRRTKPDDLARAAIARNLIAPDGGLQQSLPAGSQSSLTRTTRAEILKAVAENPRLLFWQHLNEKAELEFHGFGRDVSELGSIVPSKGDTAPDLSAQQVQDFFAKIKYDQDATAIGDAIRKSLDDTRGQSIDGILLVTDGSNNTGVVPEVAAAAAAEDGVPLFIYGVGVTTPQDLIAQELGGPRFAFLKEKCTVHLHGKNQGISGKTTKVVLSVGGKQADEKELKLQEEGDLDVDLSFIPDKLGTLDLEATIVPLEEEATKDNNTAKLKLRVVDSKFKALQIEQAPRWDFQMLFTMLQRDRRIEAKSVLIDGDKDLGQEKDSPYLNKLPEDEKTLTQYDLIILGDVNPEQLGTTRMKILADWVAQKHGCLVFHCGPFFNPSAYKGTPLEALLPVELGEGAKNNARGKDGGEYYSEPVKLNLTPAGSMSSIMMISERADENDKLWKDFPGVTWTAHVGRAKPGAQVLLTDPTPSRATRDGEMPVMATQAYGLGQVVYIGFQETYRWRSKVGEMYYARIWGQIMQGVSGEGSKGANPYAQLKTDKNRYLPGEKIVITGKLFQSSGSPLTASSATAISQMESASENGETKFQMNAVPDKPGEFQGELIAREAGSFNVIYGDQKQVVTKYEVVESHLEQADTAMNAKSLTRVAEASGGRFFREETLHELPDYIASKSEALPIVKKIELYYSPWFGLLLLLLGSGEWLLRRRNQLK